MEKATCKDCVHFRQHYIFDGKRLSPVNCGHCVCPRLKHRTPETSACNNFELIAVASEEPVTKDYITKELIRYILSFELPPEITE